MAQDHQINIEIPEAKLDFSNDLWKEQLKKDFLEIQNTLESSPNPKSPSYYTWFWFFMKYGRAFSSEEVQLYLKENNLKPFDIIKEVLGLEMSYGGAYQIGFKFYDECLKNTKGINISGLKIFINESKNRTVAINPLQQIFYGAPGTGKSHIVNERTEGESVIRTTFHPDSDYSTFVGAYKPTMGLLPICDETGQPMKIGSTILQKEQIIYEFVDQAFLQAYIQAWKFYAENEENVKKQYLIIEEINRGNCAQIFGDLFQLLDRNDYGFSVYPINADKDMKKQLEKAFKGLNVEKAESISKYYKGRNVVKEVLNGDILLLPDNLYIWATMNTSDQSLFPIDSAFKRRWDWTYMPIGKGYDENGNEINWIIEGATKKYSWWSFLEKINAQIGEATQSEDKKLGFFFCKATDNVISAEKFVGKVIFYLWNDVFKNNGFEGQIFKDIDGTELSFAKFYKSDMKGNAIVQRDKVELFLTNLGVKEVGDVIESILEEHEEDNIYNSTRDSSNRLHVVFQDGEEIRIQTCDEYVEILKKIGLDKAYEVAKTIRGPHGCAYVSKTQEEAITNHKTLRYEQVGEYFIIRQISGEQMRPFLEKISNQYNLGLQFYRQ